MAFWDPASGRLDFPRQLSEKVFGAGGCPMDVNRDGRTDWILMEAPPPGKQLGRMVWLEAPGWRVHLVDTDALFRDCLQASLWGRRGVLVIHRMSQVRFYQVPDDAAAPWPYREIYSIYTPSAQGGLLVRDVDDDGFEDILCGNYWIRNPGSARLPWRLFAIYGWWEQELSALSRLAVVDRAGARRGWNLVAAETSSSRARLAWFEKPADPRQFWIEHRLEAPGGLRYPRAMAVHDWTGDGRADILVGENAGKASRLILFDNRGGRFQARQLGLTSGVLELWPWDVDGDGVEDVAAAGGGLLAWWRNQLRK